MQAATKVISSAHAENHGEIYTTKLDVNGESFIADEGTGIGGQGLGPNPLDYLCAALASCTVITLRMYVKRKQWNLPTIGAKVELINSPENDLTGNAFRCELSFEGGELSEDQKLRLLAIAKKCPVHKLLLNSAQVMTNIV